MRYRLGWWRGWLLLLLPRIIIRCGRRRLRGLIALPLGWIRLLIGLLILLLLIRLLIGLLPVVLLLIGRLIALLLLVLLPPLPPLLPIIPLLLRVAIGAVDDLFTRQADVPALLEPR